MAAGLPDGGGGSESVHHSPPEGSHCSHNPSFPLCCVHWKQVTPLGLCPGGRNHTGHDPWGTGPTGGAPQSLGCERGGHSSAHNCVEAGVGKPRAVRPFRRWPSKVIQWGRRKRPCYQYTGAVGVGGRRAGDPGGCGCPPSSRGAQPQSLFTWLMDDSGWKPASAERVLQERKSYWAVNLVLKIHAQVVPVPTL